MSTKARFPIRASRPVGRVDVGQHFALVTVLDIDTTIAVGPDAFVSLAIGTLERGIGPALRLGRARLRLVTELLLTAGRQAFGEARGGALEQPEAIGPEPSQAHALGIRDDVYVPGEPWRRGRYSAGPVPSPTTVYRSSSPPPRRKATS